MIRRRDTPTTIIPQTAHGWLAGQLASHWGNSRFQHPGDAREMVLATSNHDQGWVTWEQNPALNAERRPTDFLEMPVAEHVKIWKQSIATVDSQSRYGALLVSRHARFLNELRLQNGNDSTADKECLQNFCTEQSAWETTELNVLQHQRYYAAMCQRSRFEAAFRLLQVFDWLSLLLCMDTVTHTIVENVPGESADERIEITLKAMSPDVFTISPWPFDVPAFSTMLQTKNLPAETFADDAAFQTVWQQIPVSFQPFIFRAERL